jgi:hypothetical protein
MKFTTYKEAEDYYMEHLALTNNMHDEETNRMENWVMEQEIDERTIEEDSFSMFDIIKRQGKEWCAKELLKYATKEEIDFADNLRKKEKE